MKQVLSSIYALNNSGRKSPITLLFLGNSGVGKTETVRFISSCIGSKMVRIQFSMRQTNNAYQYIFGANHGEDSLARELIRRKSNIVLLDEFDKVHPSFYNAFHQMFDEGIFVDTNYSVDVSKCIKGIYAMIAADEDRRKPMCRPSVRSKLDKSDTPPKAKAPKKKKEMER